MVKNNVMDCDRYTYIEAMKRKTMDNGKTGARGFLLSGHWATLNS
jgi:hypothetical protein